MSSLTIVIPIHEYNEEYGVLLNKAIDSIDTTDLDADIAVIGPKAVLAGYKKSVKNPKVSFLNNENYDYCSQVNTAAKKIDTPFFSVLEFDDELTKIWLGNVADYMAKNPASIYLPLTQMIDFKNNRFVGFINEIGWARGFYDKPGFLAIEALDGYCDFNMSGAIINKDAFIAVGGLKSSIKVFYWYEFLLRILNKGKDVYVIPKIGCKHFVNREGSSLTEYYKTATKEETNFWLQTAHEEYPFDKDRNKVYEAK